MPCPTHYHKLVNETIAISDDMNSQALKVNPLTCNVSSTQVATLLFRDKINLREQSHNPTLGGVKNDKT